MTEETKKEYFELLRFESVGADAAKLKSCVDCAMWWKTWLEKAGFEARLAMPPLKDGKASPPIVIAKREGAEGASRMLVYGHYDVQPAKVEDGWRTPPFEPVVKDGRVYCRGANDDKGQSFAFLTGVKKALEAMPAGSAPTVKVVLEGQEESGSAALISMAPELRKELAADALFVCDTSAAPDLRPAIVAGLRGVCHFTVRLKGPNRDLHSGEYGGIAPNPAQAMAELVASLHDKDGSIAVEGFLDGIEKPTDEELALASAGAASAEEYEKDMGCKPCGGEKGKSIVERNSFMPTIEVNGIHSGYGGEGSKTIIPAEAIAKLSMRLVAGQSVTKAMADVRRHLEARVPEGIEMAIEEGTGGSGALKLAVTSPLFRLAGSLLEEMDERGAVFQWDGASLPVIGVLKDASGAAPLIVGWGQAEDRIHAPDESYSFAQFDKAEEWGRLVTENLA